MKNTFLIIILLFTTTYCFAQLKDDTISNLKLKQGLYYSLEAIRNNKPEEDNFLSIYECNPEDKFKGFKGECIRSLDKNKNYNDYNKNLIGISDGDNFYVTTSYYTFTMKSINFNSFIASKEIKRTILNGPFILVPIFKSYKTTLTNSNYNSNLDLQNCVLINIKEGYSRILTRYFIYQFIKRYPTVNDEYKNKKYIYNYIPEIFEKINQIETRN